MKPFGSFRFLTAVVFAICVIGCKKEAQTDASQPLEQSFQTAEPEVKKAIETVNRSLAAKNYTEVAKALDPVLTRHNLTEPQKQAIRLTFQQINQAIAADPNLDTKEMYELRAKMSKALTSGPRF